ncbi:protein FAM32A-like [Elysia marginata]|uniref:Protein FAM32A-like n=1 Tax=Elysia marginata TaxID=1093978 RepID=A0AAV4GKR5_9GAST|nr:protein FAM32A-like [Elysia marginata]
MALHAKFQPDQPLPEHALVIFFRSSEFTAFVRSCKRSNFRPASLSFRIGNNQKSHGAKSGLKKKKDKEKKKLEVATTNSETVIVSRPSKTKAEIAFEKAKREKDKAIILERASKTHKERIMDFNQQLDNLTEHFDIPKVSWTK